MQYRDNALRLLDPESSAFSHANENQDPPLTPRELLAAGDLTSEPWRLYRFFPSGPDDELIRHATHRPSTTAAFNFAAIRKSAASDAINAVSLYRVVGALRLEGVQIRCNTIQDGTSRRFAWHSTSERFEPSTGPSAGPELLLLGPSKSLVKRHWNRLPLGTYAELAALSLHRLKYITPSNQLSYVLRMQANEQNILITGDAGFVDFKPQRGNRYHDEILRCLQPLHVVQVAHHAGIRQGRPGGSRYAGAAPGEVRPGGRGGVAQGRIL